MLDEAAECEKSCKFCFATEEDNTEMSFVHPCRCRGSIYWVHSQCLGMWFAKANPVQQVMCTQCQTRYQKQLTLKRWREWWFPRLNLDALGLLEISLDVWITSRTIRGFVGMLDGEKSIFRELLLCTLWRMFVASGKRFCYYGNLGLRFASAIFRVSIDDYDERREIRARLPSDMDWDTISQSSVLN